MGAIFSFFVYAFLPNIYSRPRSCLQIWLVCHIDYPLSERETNKDSLRPSGDNLEISGQVHFFEAGF